MISRPFPVVAGALLVAAMVSAPALAHVTIDQKEAAVGGTLRLAYRVPHGCNGAPMLRLRIRIPEGVIGVKPMPKPGWQLETVKGKYDKAYPYFGGATVSEGVKEITWSGNLPDDQYDEFVLSGFVAPSVPTGGPMYFPAVQECANAADRWIEIPAAGQNADDLKHPAPSLMLMPAAHGGHH